MEKFRFLTPLILLLLVTGFSSCELVGDIFQAGMGVGIFLVVAVVALILFIVMRAGRKK